MISLIIWGLQKYVATQKSQLSKMLAHQQSDHRLEDSVEKKPESSQQHRQKMSLRQRYSFNRLYAAGLFWIQGLIWMLGIGYLT